MRNSAVRSPRTDWVRAQGANARRESGDRTGMLRHNGLGLRTDQFYRVPILPSVCLYGPHNEWRFQNDLDVDTTNVWAEVNDNAGTGLGVQDERGGVAKFTNDTGDNDFYYYVSKFEIARLNSSKDIWFYTRIRILDVSEADWFVGLVARVSANDALFDARVDSVGFYGADGSANINTETSKDSSATQTAGEGTLVDDTFMDLAFHIVNTSTVEFFINNKYVGTHTDDLPDDTELAFAFGCRNGTTAANAMSIGRTIVKHDP